MIPGHTFKCECCEGMFMWGDDAEAEREYRETFGGEVEADASIVCTGCYELILAEAGADGLL